jgi:uncharacterized protein (DUF58 family)
MNLQAVTRQIRYLDIYTNRQVTEIFAGNYKSSFKGHGIEVHSLRPYQDGDDVRHIDWTTSAKHGQLYVKQYQETRELTTFLLIDTSASMNFTSIGKTKKQVAVEIAALLLFSALKNGDKYGALLFSDQTKVYIPAKKGRTHLLRILREIVISYQQNQQQTANPQHALHHYNQLVHKSSLTFLLSDSITTKSSQMLRIANQKHDLVFINIYDPFERQISGDQLLQVQDLETQQRLAVNLADNRTKQRYQQLRLHQYQQLKHLMIKSQIDWLDVSTQDHLYQNLLTFFKQRQLKY